MLAEGSGLEPHRLNESRFVMRTRDFLPRAALNVAGPEYLWKNLIVSCLNRKSHTYALRFLLRNVHVLLFPAAANFTAIDCQRRCKLARTFQ